MIEPQRILLIDDNPHDRVLVQRVLLQQFLHTQIVEVSDEAGFKAALMSEGFDLVITDYQLLWSNGTAVLKTVKQHFPICPVIMFTATGTQEIAVDAMKSGLDDYVIKSPKHFARLPTVIQSVLERAAQRQQMAALELERQRLFVQMQAAHQRAERAAARTHRLQTITAALVEVTTTHEVARVIVEKGIAALGASAGAFAVCANDCTAVDLIYSVGLVPSSLGAYQHTLLAHPTPITDSIRTRAVIVVETPHILQQRYPEFADVSGTEQIASIAAIPCLVDGQVIGAILLSFATPLQIDADDQSVLLTLGRLCGLAFVRARLYEIEQHRRVEAETAVQVRDQFLSVVSHELRTPLTTLLGNVELLQRYTAEEGRLSDRERQRLRVIIDQTYRLRRMIDSLLDLSRIQEGRLSLDRVLVDIDTLTRRVIEEVHPLLHDHRVDYVAPVAPVFVMGDELRLEQVLHNLLSNAAKYSAPESVITVRVERREAKVCIMVTDQGIGIPAHALPHLYSRFYRAPNVGPNISGMGIGLYVVKEIVALHQGTITIESSEGQGSSFCVCLPAAGEH